MATAVLLTPEIVHLTPRSTGSREALSELRLGLIPSQLYLGFGAEEVVGSGLDVI